MRITALNGPDNTYESVGYVGLGAFLGLHSVSASHFSRTEDQDDLYMHTSSQKMR